MNSAHRTEATAAVTVSTVRVREGRSTWYETAIIVGGNVSDPRRSANKAEAGIEHDETVAWARGYRKDAGSARVAFWTAALATVGQ